MMDDVDSDVSFHSRSKDKRSTSVTMLTETDIAVEDDDLSHRSTRGELSKI
jgi:hypothetical protein